MGRRSGRSNQVVKQSEKAREGNRRRNKRWKENNPEHVAALDRAKALRHHYKHHEKNKANMRAKAKARWDKMSMRERRDYKLRQTYGITLDDFEKRLIQQGNRCAACNTDDPGSRGWQMDHCHDKKHFRGVLCMKCNTGLGLANDSVSVLQAWINYLRRDVVDVPIKG